MAINILRKEDCCGCTACESVCGHSAISFVADDEGFLYPKVDAEKCIECGLCEAACPIEFRKKEKLQEQIQGLYAARVRNSSILKSSSSGGLFSALALKVLAEGGKVVGAVYDENMEVRHVIASAPAELAAMRGSKYSQSNLLGLFRQVRALLAKGEKVLFSGVPCQIEGLNLFLRRKYDNLVTVDVVCHAVPSPRIFREYRDLVSARLGKKLAAIKMRDKEAAGWSHNFSYRYIFKDGSERLDPGQISNWGRLYFSKLIDRPSCHECPFTNYSRPADITLADFWDDKNRRPEIRSSQGTSLVIANTEKGAELLRSIEPEVEIFPISKEDSWQPCLSHPVMPSAEREQFWSYYHAKGFKKAYNKYFTDTLWQKTIKHIKNILRPVLKPVIVKVSGFLK